MEFLKNIICEILQRDNCIRNCKHNCPPVQDIIEALNANGISVQRWIPVTERMPDEMTNVLMVCKNGAMFTGYGHMYGGEPRWRINTALGSYKTLNKGRVTHWMPLPERPKN